MGALDSAERPAAGKKGVGLRHPKRRVGIRIDMTPMVDIAFLLLIFFMVTTVFRAPQAMEMNRPPKKDVKVEIAESNVLIVLVDDEERIFWRIGEEPLEQVEKADLGGFFKEQLADNPDVTVLIKLHRDATYETMVDMMDELEYAEMSRFSLIPMSEEDLEETREML
jgi:biopolymer transport protein ExbD